MAERGAQLRDYLQADSPLAAPLVHAMNVAEASMTCSLGVDVHGGLWTIIPEPASPQFVHWVPPSSFLWSWNHEEFTVDYAGEYWGWKLGSGSEEFIAALRKIDPAAEAAADAEVSAPSADIRPPAAPAPAAEAAPAPPPASTDTQQPTAGRSARLLPRRSKSALSQSQEEPPPAAMQGGSA